MGSRALKFVLGLLFLLIVVDGILTNLLLERGVALEWNPFLKQVAGKGMLVALKVVGGLVCAVVIWDIHRHSPRLGTIVVCIGTGAYLAIVLWNVVLLTNAVV